MSKEIKTILLTGSGGMVGKNILNYYKAQQYNFLSPKREELDLLNQASLDSYLKCNKVDLVIHAAGLVGGIKVNIENPVKFLMENSYIGLNLISSCLKNNVGKILNLASSCIYPKNAKNPLCEDMILKGELEATNEGYALAKILSVKACEYISKTSQDFFYKTIIPCNLYGKYDKFDLDNSHMVPAVIAKLHNAKMNNVDKVEIWGDGKAKREFMYAEDLADFIFHAIENFDLLPQNMNIGTGVDYTIDEYYYMIAKVVDYRGIFVHNTLKPVGMERKLVDISQVANFSWKYKTGLEEGLEKTYKYYLDKICKV